MVETVERYLIYSKIIVLLFFKVFKKKRTILILRIEEVLLKKIKYETYVQF